MQVDKENVRPAPRTRAKKALMERAVQTPLSGTTRRTTNRSALRNHQHVPGSTTPNQAHKANRTMVADDEIIPIERLRARTPAGITRRNRKRPKKTSLGLKAVIVPAGSQTDTEEIDSALTEESQSTPSTSRRNSQATRTPAAPAVQVVIDSNDEVHARQQPRSESSDENHDPQDDNNNTVTTNMSSSSSSSSSSSDNQHDDDDDEDEATIPVVMPERDANVRHSHTGPASRRTSELKTPGTLKKVRFATDGTDRRVSQPMTPMASSGTRSSSTTAEKSSNTASHASSVSESEPRTPATETRRRTDDNEVQKRQQSQQQQSQQQSQPQQTRRSSGANNASTSAQAEDSSVTPSRRTRATSMRQALINDMLKRYCEVNTRPYFLLDRIGKGGTSVVFRAMDYKRRIWAVKHVSLANADQSTIEGYVNEIKVLKHLNDNNCDRVVRLVDCQVQKKDGVESNLLVVLELGETDFANILHQHKGGMDENSVRVYWQQMLKCVHAIHKLNVVHSDLKPANFIMVKGRLKLIDFGIANTIADDTTNIMRESQVGTLNFISPEALMPRTQGQSNFKLGRASDVWSLGCILHFMVFEEHVFKSTVLAHKLMAICSKEELDFSAKRTSIVGVIDVLQGCLKRHPKARLTTDALLSHPFLFPSKIIMRQN